MLLTHHAVHCVGHTRRSMTTSSRPIRGSTKVCPLGSHPVFCGELNCPVPLTTLSHCPQSQPSCTPPTSRPAAWSCAGPPQIPSSRPTSRWWWRGSATTSWWWRPTCQTRSSPSRTWRAARPTTPWWRPTPPQGWSPPPTRASSPPVRLHTHKSWGSVGGLCSVVGTFKVGELCFFVGHHLKLKPSVCAQQDGPMMQLATSLKF